MMSTHAIKTELGQLLREVAPAKSWSKRAGVVELSNWAVHNLDASAADEKVVRALALAHVMYDNERSSK